jgi:uncharacterized protein (TIGR02118 family)
MIRVTISYPAQEGARFDFDYYQSTHAELVKTQLSPHGMKSLEINKPLADGAGKAPPVVALATMLFDDLDAFKAAMGAGGKALAVDTANYTDLRPTVLISQVV